MHDLITLRVAALDCNSPRATFAPVRCRTERLRAGLTTTDLAAICGVTERTIERWQGGVTRPNGQALVRIERVLGLLTVASVEVAA